MPTLIPKVIKNFTLMIDGQGTAGICEKVTLPEIKLKTEDMRNGGMDMPRRIDMGMEVMDLKFSLAEHMAQTMRLFGLNDQSAFSGVFRAAQADNVSAYPYVIKFRGLLHVLGLGDIAAGEKTPMEATVSLVMFDLSLNGQEIVYIDVDNMIRRIGGVDQLAAQRAALSL